jgi:hypothetical protein
LKQPVKLKFFCLNKENGESNHKGESEGGSSGIHPAFRFRQFNIHTAYEFVAAQLVALFHQQKMLTGIFGIIHQLAGGVSLESQGRGYEVSFRTLPLLALLLFVCLPEKDSAEVVRSQL